MRTIVTIALLCSSLLNTFGQEKPDKLSSQQVRNLTAFTKAYGYVKYFHPSMEALSADWNEIAVRGVERVLSAKNEADLILRLDSIFKPLGSSIFIGKNTELPTDFPDYKGKVQFWHHKGSGIHPYDRSIYKSEIIRGALNVLENKYSVPLNQPFSSELVDSISISFPLAVPAKNNKKSADKVEMKFYQITELDVRLAGIIIVWNELQHFYPYWDVVVVDWSKTLDKALLDACDDMNELDYWNTLRRLMTATQDGHGFTSITNYSGKWRGVGIWPTLIDGRIIVHAHVKSLSQKITRGDEIISIDGEPALERYRKEKILISGSDQFQKRVALATLLYSTFEADSMELVLLNEKGEQYPVRIGFLPEGENKMPHLYEEIEEIEKGIYYVSLDRIEDEDFQQALPNLMKAEGIIFELKRYPASFGNYLSYLSREPLKSARWNVPKISYPDQLHLTEFDTSGRWNIKPTKSNLADKKMVFIISGRAISAAESYLGIIEHYRLGPIVGEEPTAGTNGNVNKIDLPGGFRITYTGMKVLKHDGSQHHLVGIQPTHPVKLTQQAIREGRDELIEEALAILKGEK